MERALKNLVRPSDPIELADIVRTRSSGVELAVNGAPGDGVGGSILRASELPLGEYVLDPLHPGEVLYRKPKEPQRMSTALKTRAAEHIVAETTGAATPSGSLATVVEQWAAELPASWISTELPIGPAITLRERNGRSGRPRFAKASATPSAGKQAGEKQDVPSTAFDLEADLGSTVEASAVLNWSGQLLADVGSEPAIALLAGAVARELDDAILAVLDAGATAGSDMAGALGIFDGTTPYRPTHVIASPSAGYSLDVKALEVMGVELVIDPAATKTYVVDRSGVEAIIDPPTPFEANEPSVLGRQIAVAALGTVFVHDGAAASF